MWAPLLVALLTQEHWSLRPIHKPAPPAVGDERWVRTPIDRFVLAALEARGLSPSPEADRRTLRRRVTFDLTGLPPTPKDLDADYDTLVDRLLASPRYGERWGRHWLDVVHYADTHGFDKDKPRPNAWPYRDWVIRSLNADLPYARFVTAQLAGDALDPPDAIATGFIAAGPWDFVGYVARHRLGRQGCRLSFCSRSSTPRLLPSMLAWGQTYWLASTSRSHGSSS